MRGIKILLKFKILRKFRISKKFHIGKDLRLKALSLVQFFQDIVFFQGFFGVIIGKHFACRGNSVVSQNILKIPVDLQHLFLRKLHIFFLSRFTCCRFQKKSA